MYFVCDKYCTCDVVASYVVQLFTVSIALLQYGYTPLGYAVEKGYGTIVHTLVRKHNADPTKVPEVTITIMLQ